MPETREQIAARVVADVSWTMDPSGFRIATAHAAAGVSAGVKAVTDRVREAAELDFSVWLREGTKVVRVTTKRNGYEVTESMIRVKDLRALLDQIDAELGGE